MVIVLLVRIGSWERGQAKALAPHGALGGCAAPRAWPAPVAISTRPGDGAGLQERWCWPVPCQQISGLSELAAPASGPVPALFAQRQHRPAPVTGAPGWRQPRMALPAPGATKQGLGKLLTPDSTACRHWERAKP